MGTRITRYRSFLLRIWRVGDPRHPRWRASLEDTRTRKATGFTSREALLAFLRRLDLDEESPAGSLPEDEKNPNRSSQTKEEL